MPKTSSGRRPGAKPRAGAGADIAAPCAVGTVAGGGGRLHVHRVIAGVVVVERVAWTGHDAGTTARAQVGPHDLPVQVVPGGAPVANHRRSPLSPLTPARWSSRRRGFRIR